MSNRIAATALAGLTVAATSGTASADEIARPTLSATASTGCRHLPGIDCSGTRKGIELALPLGQHRLTLAIEEFNEHEKTTSTATPISEAGLGSLDLHTRSRIDVRGRIARLGWHIPLTDNVHGELGTFIGRVNAKAQLEGSATATIAPNTLNVPETTYNGITIPATTLRYGGGAYSVQDRVTAEKETSKFIGIHQALHANIPLTTNTRLELSERAGLSADRISFNAYAGIAHKQNGFEIGAGVYAEKVMRDNLYRARMKQATQIADRFNQTSSELAAQGNEALPEIIENLPGNIRDTVTSTTLAAPRLTPHDVATTFGWQNPEVMEYALRLRARVGLGKNSYLTATHTHPLGRTINLSPRTEIKFSHEF